MSRTRTGMVGLLLHDCGLSKRTPPTGAVQRSSQAGQGAPLFMNKHDIPSVYWSPPIQRGWLIEAA